MTSIKTFRLNSPLFFLGALIFPLVSRLIFNLPRFTFGNFTDSVFYLAYSQNFHELFLRNGFLYYCTRFGTILPDSLAFMCFGPIDGPVDLRLFLACVVSGLLFHLGCKFYSRMVGITAVLLWCLEPVTTRLWCTTYLDSVAVPFLIISISLLLICTTSRISAASAGVLIAFAATSHLYLAILTILLLPLIIGARWETRRSLYLQFFWCAIGLLLTLLAASFWYRVHCGSGAFWQPTIEFMKQMAQGGTDTWRTPVKEALFNAPVWLAPFPFLLLSITQWNTLDGFGRGSFITLLFSTLFIWGGDLFAHAYALSMPFYFSFLIPAMLFNITSLAGNILNSNTLRTTKAIFFAVCVLLFTALSLKSNVFSDIINNKNLENHNDSELPDIAYKIRSLIEPASNGHSIQFWYPSQDYNLHMLQSFFLDYITRFRGMAEHDLITYPVLTNSDRDAFFASGTSLLVIMDYDNQRLSEAKDALIRTGIIYNIIASKSYKIGNKVLEVEELEIASLPHNQLLSLDLTNLEVPDAHDCKVSYLNNTACITTSKIKNGYDVWLRLDKNSKKANYFSITARAIQGVVSVDIIGVDSSTGEGKIVARTDFWPTPLPVKRWLAIPPGLAVNDICFRNRFSDNHQSKIEIIEVSRGEKISPQ